MKFLHAKFQEEILTLHLPLMITYRPKKHISSNFQLHMIPWKYASAENYLEVKLVL